MHCPRTVSRTVSSSKREALGKRGKVAPRNLCVKQMKARFATSLKPLVSCPGEVSHSRTALRRSLKRTLAMATNASGKTITIYDLSPEPGICPFVQRAKITLKEKQLPYETIYIDAKNKSQDFLDLFRHVTSNSNHRGTVPVIVDGDVKLAESHVVSEYLDLQYPQSGTKLLPTHPYKLALVRLFIENYTTAVQPQGYKIIISETKQENEEAIQTFLDGLKVIDKFLATYGDKSGDFLLGKDFSYAEAATLPFLYRVHLFLKEYRDLTLSDLIKDNNLANLARWQKAGFERPSVKETFPPDSVILERGRDRVKVAVKDLK